MIDTQSGVQISNRTFKRSGARTRADRVSQSLTMRKARNIIDAVRYAYCIDLPLNRHVTVHCERAGISDDRAAAATSQFLKLASDWIGKRGGKFAWIWVRENGPFSGSHVRILMHVPAGAEIGRMFRSWIKRVSNQPYKRNTVKTTRVAGRANSATITPALYPEPGGRADRKSTRLNSSH